MRAAIYARISQDREGAGLGVARQEADCRALADSLNADVTDVYVDNDVSAFDRRKVRPSYLRLLDDVREGRVDVVLAWHTDRLHRSPRELEDWIDACEQGGATVHTVKAGPLDLATPSGRMVARQLGTVARYESEQKRDRNLRKAQELAEAGKIGNGGPRPFGYQPDRMRLDPYEAGILRECYSAVLSGRAIYTIVADLHARGIKTTTGGAWSAQGLRFALLRARNIGWREHHGKLVAPAVWEPLIDRQTWEQTRAVLTDPGRCNVGQIVGRRYLLTGFLACGLCGQPLRSARGVDIPRFACRKAPGSPACGSITVRYEPLEDHMVALVLARLERDSDLQPDDDDPAEELRQRIAVIEGRIEAMADAFADDGGDLLEFRRLGQRYREQIADLRRQITRAGERRRMSDPVEIRVAWPTYDLAQRRAVVAELIERVDVAPGRVGLNRFDPMRLSVVWR